mmetsp:Transcript_8824/g.26802  ORF Transcript_8824/g.26802 Transcript_8824/m.26802 type:complete len:205 (-) Transcript_8824:568-1182(-)
MPVTVSSAGSAPASRANGRDTRTYSAAFLGSVVLIVLYTSWSVLVAALELPSRTREYSAVYAMAITLFGSACSMRPACSSMPSQSLLARRRRVFSTSAGMYHVKRTCTSVTTSSAPARSFFSSSALARPIIASMWSESDSSTASKWLSASSMSDSSSPASISSSCCCCRMIQPRSTCARMLSGVDSSTRSAMPRARSLLLVYIR